MAQDLIDNVRKLLRSRGLSLAGSVGRIIIMLPERGRVNVIALDESGFEHAITLFLDETGEVSLRAADEFTNVRIIEPSPPAFKHETLSEHPRHGRIGKRKR
ncbi:hypothetical protein ACI0X9_003391 [Cronobacter turicensis]